ncbi:MAG: histidine--tRNA ligase [Mycoplasmoidaceae bacterium]|nr:histidine--tRNA ligase [Mycoplasmoidaceae bacterium]
MNLTKPRGTQDYIYELEPGFDIVCQTCRTIAKLNGFYQIKTPTFEYKELFIRTVGDTTDIVNKEFYEFKDKGDRDMVLRPELTASVCRAIVENKLLQRMAHPIKFFYIEPMYRYERPQSGRLRLFHQFGVECVASNSYHDDVDMILLATSILNAFNLTDYVIKINNICSSATRAKWIEALKIYFKDFKDQLTEDSQARLDRNPLRILDDKIDGKKDFVKVAPKITQFATNEEIEYFKKITDALTELQIPYAIDDTLVRGLDYYCNFIFEIESTSELLKGQPTLIGGGRYNTMIKELGGDDANCVGFALGIERLLVALTGNSVLKKAIDDYKHIDVVVANLSEDTNLISTMICKMLRIAGFSCTTNRNTTKLEKHFKYAESQGAKYVIIVGPKDVKKQSVLIKNQLTMKQEEVKIAKLVDYFIKKKGKEE